jgi:hypothetical protein
MAAWLSAPRWTKAEQVSMIQAATERDEHRNYVPYFAFIAAGAAIGLIVTFVLFQLSKPFNATTSPHDLARLQSERPDTVIQPFDIRYNADFKIRRLEIDKPAIVWFGTSRAGSVRSYMFRRCTFYNMAFTGWTTEQLEDAFERATRVERPSVAIISLDFFLFSDRWERQLRTSRQMIFDDPLRYFRSSLGFFLRSAIMNWPVFRAYENSPTHLVGPQTILSHEGFGHDGSWVYTTDHIEKAASLKSADFLLSTTAGEVAMSEWQKQPIAALAAIAKARGIKIVAVQLPYIRVGVDALDSRPPNDQFFGIWHDFQSEATKAWFGELGMDYLDLSHSSIDNDPSNFIDAYHLSEKGTSQAVEELMRRISLPGCGGVARN